MDEPIKSYKVIFSPRSRRDLRTIVERVRRASYSAEIALRLGTRLIHKAISLTSLPERGRVVPELGFSDVREIIFKSYRIVYRVKADRVEILRFWHAARGAPEINLDEFQE